MYKVYYDDWESSICSVICFVNAIVNIHVLPHPMYCHTLLLWKKWSIVGYMEDIMEKKNILAWVGECGLASHLVPSLTWDGVPINNFEIKFSPCSQLIQKHRNTYKHLGTQSIMQNFACSKPGPISSAGPRIIMNEVSLSVQVWGLPL